MKTLNPPTAVNGVRSAFSRVYTSIDVLLLLSGISEIEIKSSHIAQFPRFTTADSVMKRCVGANVCRASEDVVAAFGSPFQP